MESEASDAQLRLPADAMSAFVSFIDKDERYGFVNDAWLRHLGRPREAIAGAHVRDVLGAAEYDAVQPLVRRALSGETFTLDRELVSAAGPARHVRHTYIAQHSVTGEVIGVVALVHDVSDDVRFRARSGRLQAITSGLLSAVTEVDVARVVLREASAGLLAHRALFYALDDRSLRLVAVDAALAADGAIDLDANVPVAQAVRTGEPLFLEDPAEVVQLHPGILEPLPPRTLAVLPLPGTLGPVGALVLSFLDPRKLDAAERAFLLSVAQQASLALQRARLYDEAQRAVRQREEFLSVASHELRTPLTSLKLQLQIVERALTADVAARAGRPLARAGRQVERLTALIDSLLDVSRLTEGRLQLELAPVELTTLVGDVIERTADLFAQADCAVTLDVEPGLQVLADAARLDQVLLNLLSNAAKYGAGKPVHVRAVRDGARVRIDVRDAGIGIAPAVAARLFRRFERGVSERNYGGLGLGLFISRQLMEAMGGSVDVESAPERGATFSIHLQAVQ